MSKKEVLEDIFGSDHELESVLKQIKKQYGDGAVMMLGESQTMDIESIPSGSLSLDCALGIGGYPKGRIVEIYGPESSGKTTLAIHAVAEAQKMGLLAAYIDAEHAFDKEYASNLGVNVNKLLFAQPDCGEDCLEIATKLISSGKIGILVIDSVAALIPRAELEGEMGDARIGLQARLMSQALRKMIGIIKKTNCLCIFINQIREKIGVMFGNPETTTGGNALKFYASMRLEVRKSTAIKEGDEAIANLTKVKVVKNKCAPPFRKAEFEIEFGRGINRFSEIIEKAIEFDIIHKSGSWFSYEDCKLGQGKANVIKLLEDNPELLEEVEAKVISQINNKDLGIYELEDILGNE
jgi:recombination protein RecA